MTTSTTDTELKLAITSHQRAYAAFLKAQFARIDAEKALEEPTHYVVRSKRAESARRARAAKVALDEAREAETSAEKLLAEALCALSAARKAAQSR